MNLARKFVSNRFTKSSDKSESFFDKTLNLNPDMENSKILELLPPGSFATIKNHPNDLPPFQVINCKGGRCWVRQQSWGSYVHWEVEHHLLKSA